MFGFKGGTEEEEGSGRRAADMGKEQVSGPPGGTAWGGVPAQLGAH